MEAGLTEPSAPVEGANLQMPPVNDALANGVPGGDDSTANAPWEPMEPSAPPTQPSVERTMTMFLFEWAALDAATVTFFVMLPAVADLSFGFLDLLFYNFVGMFYALPAAGAAVWALASWKRYRSTPAWALAGIFGIIVGGGIAVGHLGAGFAIAEVTHGHYGWLFHLVVGAACALVAWAGTKRASVMVSGAIAGYVASWTATHLAIDAVSTLTMCLSFVVGGFAFEAVGARYARARGGATRTEEE